MPQKKPRFWKSLPPEDKKGIVQDLLEAGYTRAAIGKALGTTKNAVVGYQHRSLPDLTGKSEGTLEIVSEARLRELLVEEWPVAAASKSLQPKPAGEETARTRPKVAASEAAQCVHRDKDNLRCAFEWTDPKTKMCDLHK